MQTTGVARLALGGVMLVLGLLAPTAAKATGEFPAARVGVAYSGNPVFYGPGYTQFSITNVYVDGGSSDIGQVPGLTMDPATGTIRGTPTRVGRYHIYYRLYDGPAGRWGYNEEWLSVNAPTITLSPSSVPDAIVGTAYSQSITASGGSGTYTYTATPLPLGLTLSPAGMLSGTPATSTVGTFNFSVTATDGNGYTGSRSYALKINPSLSAVISQQTNIRCPGGSDGSLTVTASGGTRIYSYIWSPSGGTGAIASGLYPETYIVTVEDTTGATTTASATLTEPAAFGWSSLAPGGVGAAYAGTISTTGGTGTRSYTIASGALPPGLSLGADGAMTGTPEAAGSYEFQVNVTDANACIGLHPFTLTIGKAAQAITGFAATPVAPTYAPNGNFTVSATPGASSSPVVFVSTSASVCTVSGNTVTMLAAGTCSLTADQASDANYSAAPQATLDVAISAATQAITGFVSNPATPTFAPNGTFTVSATGGASSSPVVFASTSASVCSVSGNTVTMLAAGTCSLSADQASDANYSAAPQAMLDVAISAATQAITGFAANPVAPTYAPNGSFTVSATPGASSSPVVFASTSASVCTVSGNTVTMLAAGMCSLAANQAGDANYDPAPQVVLDVTIGNAAQGITGFAANPAQPTYAPNGTFTVSAIGGASTSPVVFASTSPSVCTVAGNVVTMLGAGSCALTANQAGDANYDPAPQVVLNVTIGQAVPILGWIGGLHRVYGEAAFELPDPASDSNGAFSFSSSDAAVATVDGRTVTLTGAGNTTLTAIQAATANYAAATVSITLVVDDRPDPTRDPSVSGGLQAQVDASVRFAAAQQSNIGDRLRQVRSSGANPSHNGMALNVVGGPALMLLGGQVAGEPERSHGWGVWSAGSITTGERDAGSLGGDFEFSSNGVTVGADRLFGDALFGIAVGMGWNDTDLDPAGSQLDASQRSLAAYGMWRAGEHWYVDGLLGFGRLEFDIDRWSTVAGALASAQRDGDQWFGSLSAGYQHQAESMLLTGYGRLDASRTTLDAYRESGLGVYDLAYREQRIDSSSVALGVEGSYLIRSGSRSWRPFWLAEYRNALEDSTTAGINYVVQPRETDYVLGLRSFDRNVWAFGGGVDLDIDSGWSLSLLFRRERSDHVESSSIGFRVSYGAPSNASASPELLGGAQEAATRALMD